jgi:integrase
MRIADDEKQLPKLSRKVNLTVRTIEAAKCPVGRKRIWIHDSKAHGLAVSVMPSGTKTFYAYRWVKNRPQQLRLGRFGEISIDQARRLAGHTSAKIADGIDPMAEKRKRRAGQTLGSLFIFYMEHHAKVHKRPVSWQGDEGTFRRYLKPWTNRKLDDIERRDVQFLHAKVGQDHGHYAANRMLAMLSKMFNVARDIGHEVNPVNGIRRFREQSRDRFLGADELPKFFSALQEEPNETIRDYIMVALLTGGRRSNAMGMRWADISFDRSIWSIPHDDSKNGQAMTVYLADPVMEILNRRREGNDSPFVFPSYGRSGHIEDIKCAWTRILNRAGIVNLRLHDLRRTLGSWQAATGASLPVIGKSLGHKNVATTAIYARLNLDPVKQSVNAATAAILGTGNDADQLA